MLPESRNFPRKSVTEKTMICSNTGPFVTRVIEEHDKGSISYKKYSLCRLEFMIDAWKKFP